MTAAPTSRAEFFGCTHGIPSPGVTAWCVTFKGNPKDAPGSAWAGRAVTDAASLAGPGNGYVTLGVYCGRRSVANCVGVWGVLLDDLSAEQVAALPLRPSWVLETSPGNFQAVFLFDTLVPDLASVDRLQRALIAAGWSDPGADGPAARYVRMPFSTNGKHSPPWPCRLPVWAPWCRYTPDSVALGFGLTLEAPATDRTDHAAPEWLNRPEAERIKVMGELQSALSAIPADDRAVWVATGQGLAGLGDDGKALWMAWSATSHKFDADVAEQTWATFSGERTNYRSVFTRAQGLGWVNPGRRTPDALAWADPAALPATASAVPVPSVMSSVTAAAPLGAEASEDGLALTFAATVGHRFRWSSGMGWMTWEAPVWVRDAGLTRYDAARILCRAAASRSHSDAEQRRLGSAKTVQATLTLAQADHRIVVADAAWDADPMVLNTPGGVLDLRTGQVCDRDGHLMTRCAAVAPDFTAAAPTFDRFLNAVFQGDPELIAFVQRTCGYLLTGSTREQALFFLHGQGANGKSTLVDLLMWLTGGYALKVPATTLMARRNGEQHPTGIAQLLGRRLAVSSELDEGSFFNEALIKELTGDATLTARFMQRDFFTFTQTQKHVIVGNHKPRLRGGDPALARRMVLVPFAATFSDAQRDPDMLANLKAEGPAVLAWAVRGAVQWHAEGLDIPATVRAASTEYLQSHDDLALWVDERCSRTGESKAGDLYSDFRRWKESRGEQAPALTVWGERLQRIPGIEKRRSNGIRYSQISLNPIPFVQR